MISVCESCARRGDDTMKECSVFIFPPHYKPDSSIMCDECEEGMRKMVNDRANMFKELMEHSVRAPELEKGLDPIYVCGRCNENFSSKETEKYCPPCKKVENTLERITK